MDRQRQQQQGGNAPSPRGGRGGGVGGAAASGKRGKSVAAAGKKPIKVVYISNPMRVKTSAAGFRAIVQELTGRHADPSKYSPEVDLQGGAGVTGDDGLSPEGPAAAASADTANFGAAEAANSYDVGAPAAAAFDGVVVGGGGSSGGYDDDEDNIFGSQLLDTNNYAVFSPPTFYDHPYSKV